MAINDMLWTGSRFYENPHSIDIKYVLEKFYPTIDSLGTLNIIYAQQKIKKDRYLRNDFPKAMENFELMIWKRSVYKSANPPIVPGVYKHEKDENNKDVWVPDANFPRLRIKKDNGKYIVWGADSDTLKLLQTDLSALSQDTAINKFNTIKELVEDRHIDWEDLKHTLKLRLKGDAIYLTFTHYVYGKQEYNFSLVKSARNFCLVSLGGVNPDLSNALYATDFLVSRYFDEKGEHTAHGS